MIIWLASNNRHKWREINQIAQNLGSPLKFRMISEKGASVFPDETGDTFRANAILKAQYALNFVSPSDWIVAEDSGLVVPVLGGEPGIFSARYAGQDASDRDNIQKLLDRLEGVPASLRVAYYVCQMVLMRASEPPAFFEGIWWGRVTFEPLGHNGFGYDPIFVPEGLSQTVAQLSEDLKNQLSHRAQALKSLIKFF